MNNNSKSIASIERLRFLTDGDGIFTLVCFQGCPLRCKMCANPYAVPATSKYATAYTPQTLYDKVKLDELYFIASGGGVTFGGGEPLLHPEFIQEFRKLCKEQWHLCVETSLAVPWENIAAVADIVDVFYFDCKDIDPEIYKAYTGKENTLVLENIKKLSDLISPEKIVVRIPLIPGFNTEANQQQSAAFFKTLGLTRFDLFTYMEPERIQQAMAELELPFCQKCGARVWEADTYCFKCGSLLRDHTL